MELNEDGFLEELLALRRETWETTNPATEMMNSFFSTTTWGFDDLDSTPEPSPPILPKYSSSYDSFSPPIQPGTNFDCPSFTEFYANSGPLIPSEPAHFLTGPLGPDPNPTRQPELEYPASLVEGSGGEGQGQRVGHVHGTCKPELEQSPSGEIPVSPFNVSLCMRRNGSKVKKIEGQPSKNLMAERRRRKRLNDRLSMLRSVVPKISKMDRTSILGDTIDYMKELLERINSLQEESDVGSNGLNLMSIFKNVKPNDVLIRNSPKFDVERRKLDTRVEICCAGKPGLLLSTVTTLEALGLEIQHCVISCFNDFSLQASCSEEMEQRSLMNSEDIKQALFRNAGYGGRCL